MVYVYVYMCMRVCMSNYQNVVTQHLTLAITLDIMQTIYIPDLMKTKQGRITLILRTAQWCVSLISWKAISH